jgi:thioesterase domain-containing protein/SAM-dependent methyltransferase/acyl carrier protein
VLAWLSTLLRDQVQAREFEHAPLDQIRSWSAMPPARQLFDSIRVLENYPIDSAHFHTGNVSIGAMRAFEQTNYALSFVVVPNEELLLQVWFDALQFEQDTVEHLLADVEAVLMELVADAERPLGEVMDGVADQQARRRMPAARDMMLPQAVAHWAAQYPERVAVIGPSGRLSYRLLDERANQLANWLVEAGIGAGARVASAHPTGVDGVVAMLAVLKVGATYIPVGQSGSPQPAELVARTGPTVYLAPVGHRTPLVGVTTVSLDSAGIADQPTGPPPGVEAAPDEVALIVSSDELAGLDSLTELTHREVLRWTSEARQEGLSAGDVVAQLAATGTDVSAWETWTALVNGAKLVLCPPPGSPLAEVGQVLREHGVTVVAAVAPQLQELLDQDVSELRSVRLLFVQGALAAPYVRRLRAAVPSLRVVRGSGIEVNRIERGLRRLPGVGEAAVRPSPDGQRLIAYLVPDLEGAPGLGAPGAELAERHVAEWRKLYDQTYTAGTGPADPTFNIVGWNSSYTGEQLPAEAMREWRDHTMERICALRPSRVLEIGCGTGLLTLPLLAHCERYVGTDFSAVCLEQLNGYLATLDEITRRKVMLLERTADDFSGLEPASFDVIILNSVVQYFPDVSYLTAVLDGALRACTPVGFVLLGDVRHYGLLEVFQTSVALHRAADDLATEELRTSVRRAIDNERELLVDPAFFLALAAERAEIGAVEIMPKRGRHDNELTHYRYEVVLHRAQPTAVPTDVEWYDWRRDVLSHSEIGWLLDNTGSDMIGLTGVPNARLATDVAAVRLLSDPEGPATAAELRAAAGRSPRGLDPDELHGLAERRGWTAAVSWAASRSDGSVDVLFFRKPDLVAAGVVHVGRVVEDAGTPTGALTNVPLRSSVTGELERRILSSLREALPAHLAVSGVMVLPALPHTSDGEIDHATLPLPEEPTEPGGADFVPARTADELRLARIWERALRVPAIDVRSSFFDLGGDSLLAIRVVGEATRVFNREVPITSLLQDPTIEGMAAALQATRGDWSPLVEITAGDETPFFCVHPAGGNVLCYAELARLVGPDQPFYGLQARGLDGRDPPYDDIPTMAARYLEDVRRVWPAGPYLLGGWSMGGHIAYEMAQQLRAAGEPIRLLTLIDAPTPDLVEELPDEVTVLVRLLEGVVALDKSYLESLSSRDRLQHVLVEAERVHAVPPGMDLAQAQHLLDVHATHVRAVRRYLPAPYPGPVVLLRAAQTEIAAPDYGWRRLLTGQLQVVEVPGNHETVIWPPNVQRLADELQTHLSAARTRSARVPRR